MTGRSPYRQSDFAVRFDWGGTGASVIAEGAAVAVVVDVLSFTTSLSVAADLGVEVFPFRFRDATAAAFAASRGAVLAVGRSEARMSGISLSPVSIRSAAEDGPLAGVGKKLVLPSPNGSAIARQLAEAGVVVVGASLRNAKSVARWVTAAAPGGPVALVAAGERWPGDLLRAGDSLRPADLLRPAVEDLWGAGAVIDALAAVGVGPLSPEAGVARAAWLAVRGSGLVQALRTCASGLELIQAGDGEELAVALEVDRSTSVPVLRGESFVA